MNVSDNVHLDVPFPSILIIKMFLFSFVSRAILKCTLDIPIMVCCFCQIYSCRRNTLVPFYHFHLMLWDGLAVPMNTHTYVAACVTHYRKIDFHFRFNAIQGVLDMGANYPCGESLFFMFGGSFCFVLLRAKWFSYSIGSRTN